MQATIFGTTVSLILAVPLILQHEVLGAAVALGIGTACETAFLLVVFRTRFKSWNWKHES